LWSACRHNGEPSPMARQLPPTSEWETKT
jgi:hypothetical protein